MRAWLNGLAAVATVAILAPGAGADHQFRGTVDIGTGGASTTWWNLEGNGRTVVIDHGGHRQHIRCPPGQSIAIVQSARGGGQAMAGSAGAGGVTSSVSVGGGWASASTSHGGSGVGVVTGPGGASQVTVTCR
jgi:hypothetical protein